MRLFSDQHRLLSATYHITGGVNADELAWEAINQSYREIAGVLPWDYLHRRAQINTHAAIANGTIGYNASTNVLTLTGSTWPSWVQQGLLIINTAIYAVQNSLSSTTVSLLPGRAPVTDIASGTSYVLIQSEYVLPEDWLRMEDFITVGNVWLTQEVEPGSLLQMSRMFYNAARPWMYTVRGSTYYAGRLAIEFAPPPDANYTYDMSYFVKPRPRTLGQSYTGGTITVSGTTVTGVNTNFTQAMVGCRLRQGTANSIPVGEYGPLGSMHENSIRSVASATSLQLVDVGNSASNIQFLIDDPVDVERMSMDECFCRMCEYQFAQLTRSDKRQQVQDDMVMALRNARARDVRTQPRKNIAIVPSFEALAYANLGGR